MIEKFLDNIKNKWKQKNILQEYSFMIKPFLCIAIIFAISISAIIRADYNYVDDLRRVAIGYSGWDNHSRFVSTFLSKIIHADGYLTDISPYHSY